MITRVEKVTVYVDSQEAAKEFWVDKVGFVVSFEQEMGPGMTWLEVSPRGENLTSLVLYSKELMTKQNPSAVCHPSIIFATDDADGSWQELKDNGVEVTDLQEMPYGKMFNFTDPEGNVYMVRG
ncbi:MAG: VOC family protein [Candidatus Aquicultorales bacterium]